MPITLLSQYIARWGAPLLAVMALLLAVLPARAFETRAGSAWIYDLTTGTVLLEKNADVPLPPASMSKLMTLYMLFEALEDGRVSMETEFPVSTRARSMGGSTMFLNEMDRPTVKELIYGIVINSGNDACVVVAEGLAGSEETFSRQMTERARALGMTRSVFTNSSGWPHPDHRMSMHDLGLISVRLIEDFPQYYPYFALTEYNYKDRAPANSFNRNPMLRLGGGGDWTADGLKTGHTQEAGYGLAGSAVHRDGRRIVFVISGLGSEADRAQESEALTNWAFRQFSLKTVAKGGARLAEMPVWLGAAGTVGLVPAEDVQLLVPAVSGPVTAEAIFDGPASAPVAAGQELGRLEITVPGIEARHVVPLVAESAVAAGGIGTRMKAALGRLTVMARQAADS